MSAVDDLKAKLAELNQKFSHHLGELDEDIQNGIKQGLKDIEAWLEKTDPGGDRSGGRADRDGREPSDKE